MRIVCSLSVQTEEFLRKKSGEWAPVSRRAGSAVNPDCRLPTELLLQRRF